MMNGLSFRTTAILLAAISTHTASCQLLASNNSLPDSPGATLQAATPPRPSELHGSSRIQGLVEDSQGIPVAEARVVLTAPGRLGERTITTASDGSFNFPDLPAGTYRLIVSAPGLTTYTSGEMALRTDQTIDVPKIPLRISTSSTVEVIASPDQVAVAQVHEQEKQRVLGVFPNFYTSYIWKAEPMPAGQKYKLAGRALVDPFTFLIIAGIAGAEHFNGTYPGYGSGIQGYGKRYAAAYGDALTARVVGSAILPAVLHQDPRYFYQGSGGVRSRTWHAIASTFVCRGDNGKTQPNFSHMLGSLAAGGVANAYHPESSRGIGLTFETFGITTGANAIGNLFREFVFRGLVPSVPEFATGKK
jgi:hypothetical protein